MAAVYEQKRDFKKALEYYEDYLKVGHPGTLGYEYAERGIAAAKQELFMEGR